MPRFAGFRCFQTNLVLPQLRRHVPPVPGLGRSQCPECGHWFDPANPSTYGPQPVADIPIRDRTILVCAAVAGAWPLVTIAAMYLARVAGWVALGRWPRSSADDPKAIGPAVDVLHGLGVLAVALSNVAVVGGVFLVLVALLRQRWRAAAAAAALVAGGWAVFAVLANLDDTVEWFMD